jgi:hypothetical protein
VVSKKSVVLESAKEKVVALKSLSLRKLGVNSLNSIVGGYRAQYASDFAPN